MRVRLTTDPFQDHATEPKNANKTSTVKRRIAVRARAAVRSKFAISALAFTSLVCGGMALLPHGADAAAVQDCSNNSIIQCGAQTPADFIHKVKTNNPADLQGIYAQFQLGSPSYDDFGRDAKTGTAYKNGDIVVDGITVAKDAWSIGREKKSYSTDYVINGKTYFKSMDKDVFAVDSMPVMVFFNDHGGMQFAVLTPCGNPVTGTPVNPAYSCDQLQKTAVQGQVNTYQFTTKATATSGAALDHVVYDFGDGSPTVSLNSLAAPVTHTYATAGTYTAKVTVYVKTAAGMMTAVSTNCQTQITVTPPPPAATAQCSNLAAVKGDDDLTYIFKATASLANATLTGTDFDFGDGSMTNSVSTDSANGNTTSVTHSYAKAGTYTAKATLHFAAQGQNASSNAAPANATCQTTVTVTQTPPATPTATPPVTLPSTGPATPAGMAGIFSGASAIGALGYRIRSKRRLSKIDRLFESLKGDK